MLTNCRGPGVNVEAIKTSTIRLKIYSMFNNEGVPNNEIHIRTTKNISYRFYKFIIA
ncbi:hypothetical protein K170097C1_52510 [Hungatella effluvii]